MGFLGSILGYVLWAVYYVLKDFGLSIIVFTLLIKLVLFYPSVKQQKSMAGTQRLQKKQKELQEKYANNKVKLQEEMDKLYQKEGVKPMGGCLTMLIPLFVILGVFSAVSQPLTNTLHLKTETVNQAIAYVNTIPGYSGAENPNYQQIDLIKIFPSIADTETIQDLFSEEEINDIIEFGDSFNSFGLNLFTIPKDKGILSVYFLIPVICFASYIAQQLISQKINGNNMAGQQGCMKVMLYAMPLFSAYIAYTVPSAVGFYWICSSLFGLIQSVIMGKLFSPAQLIAKQEARHVALMELEEKKIPYIYAPKEIPENSGAKVNKKKKK